VALFSLTDGEAGIPTWREGHPLSKLFAERETFRRAYGSVGDLFGLTADECKKKLDDVSYSPPMPPYRRTRHTVFPRLRPLGLSLISPSPDDSGSQRWRRPDRRERRRTGG
jgi:hypothetical protein